MEEPHILKERLRVEINRVLEIIKEYDALPSGSGALGAYQMKVTIAKAEDAISNNNIGDMKSIYKALQGHVLL